MTQCSFPGKGLVPGAHCKDDMDGLHENSHHQCVGLVPRWTLNHIMAMIHMKWLFCYWNLYSHHGVHRKSLRPLGALQSSEDLDFFLLDFENLSLCDPCPTAYKDTCKDIVLKVRWCYIICADCLICHWHTAAWCKAATRAWWLLSTSNVHWNTKHIFSHSWGYNSLYLGYKSFWPMAINILIPPEPNCSLLLSSHCLEKRTSPGSSGRCQSAGNKQV